MRKQTKRQWDDQKLDQFKTKLLQFLQQEEAVAVLDSCSLPSANNIKSYDLVAGFGIQNSLSSNELNALDDLYTFHNEVKDWIFGVLSYDLKNNIHTQLSSNNPDYTQQPLVHFFQAQNIIFIKENELLVESINDPDLLIESILDCPIKSPQKLQIRANGEGVSREEYLQTIDRIKAEIRAGNVYELNYCLNHHYRVESDFRPVEIFDVLRSISPAPFASVFSLDGHALVGSSPERYIKKTGNRIVSQPIKGTRPRMDNEDEDLQQKIELQNSLKERAENVMIVDLVRNDLAHTSTPGSVKVSELFGIYSYKQVHQMVSTIESELRQGATWLDVIRQSFPMGSMTGAPKIAAMKLIDELESFKRGWYSGALGYVTPSGDFDFNVLIRSMYYNSHNKNLSYAVGGAITYDSTAEAEWDECILKAKALEKLLEKMSTKEAST